MSSSNYQTYAFMKIIGLIFLLLLVTSQVKAQTQSTSFFGQCMIEVATAEEMAQLQTTMRENPYIKVVRLDYNTQRAFILTQNLESLTEENFISWFSQYADKVKCVQVGQHGVHSI